MKAVQDHLRWLSLTFAIRREWSTMMDELKTSRRPARDPALVYMRDVLAGARAAVEAAKSGLQEKDLVSVGAARPYTRASAHAELTDRCRFAFIQPDAPVRRKRSRSVQQG